MNYEPVTAGNQTNDDVGIEINVNAGQARQEKASDHEYILLPFMPSNSPLSSSTQSSDDKDGDKVPGKVDEGVNKGCGIDDQERTDSSTQDVNTVEPSINTISININIGILNINNVGSNDLSMPSLEETGIFEDVYDDRKVGVETDTNNLELLTVVKQKDNGIFISQDKYVADILKKFDFTTVKTASTLMEPNKALIKDAKAEDVDVHLYRSMIRSLMYLTASSLDIMFEVCACARDSPFDLEAFCDSDYAGASLDRKSTIGGCQFLGKRLIS
uniref:Ribonuclease H-like domain, reverse transcriptase, RNA-dependent DNA polymerase n=1 Tax=Tanacetum cinerariifolium TaxID=118510 RepID=A0A699KUH6_TANCI|nr:ribonuclease H-like domain, reverse transcriptase, RNA-dependent DNA polymerase [Tanacetum cinerariifolium]